MGLKLYMVCGPQHQNQTSVCLSGNYPSSFALLLNFHHVPLNINKNCLALSRSAPGLEAGWSMHACMHLSELLHRQPVVTAPLAAAVRRSFSRRIADAATQSMLHCTALHGTAGGGVKELAGKRVAPPSPACPALHICIARSRKSISSSIGGAAMHEPYVKSIR